MKNCIVLLTTLLFLTAGCVWANTIRYNVSDLGWIQNVTLAYGINSVGQVAGYSLFSHAVRWNVDGTHSDIPLAPGALYEDGYGINDAGYVVGDAAMSSSGYGRAWIWKGGEDLIVIPLLSGYLYNKANSVSNSGVVVGCSVGTDSWHKASAYKWSEAGGITKLNPMPGFIGSIAEGVNDLNQVVGASAPDGNGDWRACLWQPDGTVESVGPLSLAYSCAGAINENGQVVGGAEFTPHGPTHAFIWTKQLGMTDLGTLSDGNYSWASDVNNSGIAVGYSSTKNYSECAVVWQSNSGPIALPVLPDMGYSHATGVNDMGLICGYGIVNGQYHALLWEPVPEPSSVGVLLISLLGFAMTMLRQKTNAVDEF